MERLASVGIFGLDEDDVGTFRSVTAPLLPHLVRLEAELGEKPAPEVDRGSQIADVDFDVVEANRHASNGCMPLRAHRPEVPALATYADVVRRNGRGERWWQLLPLAIALLVVSLLRSADVGCLCGSVS